MCKNGNGIYQGGWLGVVGGEILEKMLKKSEANGTVLVLFLFNASF